jgi:hypothetical protein
MYKFWPKISWATFWAIFLLTLLVTLWQSSLCVLPRRGQFDKILQSHRKSNQVLPPPLGWGQCYDHFFGPFFSKTIGNFSKTNALVVFSDCGLVLSQIRPFLWKYLQNQIIFSFTYINKPYVRKHMYTLLYACDFAANHSFSIATTTDK